MAKRVTLSEIGKKAGVSDVSVGAALGLLSKNSSVRLNPEKAEAIRKVAAELGYQPNLLARAFRNQSTKMVGVLFRVVSSPVSVSYTVDCMHRELLANKYHANLTPFQGRFSILEESIQTMLAWRVDGIILSHVFATDDKEARWPLIEKALDKAKVPIVFIESDIPTVKPRPSVNADLGLAMETAARKLISLGHTKLAFVSDHRGPTPVRWAGIQRALADHPGVTIQQLAPTYDTTAPPIQQMTLAVQELGRNLAAVPAAARPTGIICNNDFIASSLITGMTEAGLKIPQDASITGYDNSEHAVLARPTLTSFAPPIEQMASTAVRLLLEQLDNPKTKPQHHKLQAPLVERNSTAKI
jgi:DNA-binding LacI/PurR family transcriptional regulator